MSTVPRLAPKHHCNENQSWQSSSWSWVTKTKVIVVAVHAVRTACLSQFQIQRSSKQNHNGVGDDGTGNGHTLTLSSERAYNNASRNLPTEPSWELRHALFDFFLSILRKSERCATFSKSVIHMWKQGIGLLTYGHLVYYWCHWSAPHPVKYPLSHLVKPQWYLEWLILNQMHPKECVLSLPTQNWCLWEPLRCCCLQKLRDSFEFTIGFSNCHEFSFFS